MKKIANKYANQKLQIVEFSEKQLFRIPPIENEVCHLTFDMWKDLRKTILSGEYGQIKEDKNETNH